MSGGGKPGAPLPDADAEALIAEMGREAQEQKQAILAEAQARAQDAMSASETEMESAAADAARRMEKQSRIDAERLLGQVRLEAAAERLRACREVYQNAVGAARERILDMARGAGGADAVRALIAEALEKVPGDVQVSVCADDRSLCAEMLKKLGRSGGVQTVDGPRGTVIVSSKDGRRKVDNSLTVRLERAAQSMEALIAGRLFGKE